MTCVPFALSKMRFHFAERFTYFALDFFVCFFKPKVQIFFKAKEWDRERLKRTDL